MMIRASLLLATTLLLGACATSGAAGDPPLDLRDAEVSSRTLENGDTIEEYRVAGQVRMVKVTPVRGASYYMYDRNGDGRMDSDRDGIAPVYWKLYSW